MRQSRCRRARRWEGLLVKLLFPRRGSGVFEGDSRIAEDDATNAAETVDTNLKEAVVSIAALVSVMCVVFHERNARFPGELPHVP